MTKILEVKSCGEEELQREDADLGANFTKGRRYVAEREL